MFSVTASGLFNLVLSFEILYLVVEVVRPVEKV